MTVDVGRAFEEHGSAIFGFALNATRDRTLAEECVQETFVRAWRFRERYAADRGSERTWLFAIARRVVIDLVRSRARRPVLVAESADVAADAPSAVDPSETVVGRLDLVAAVAQLSAKHRQVVTAVALGRHTYESLSEQVGVPVATLRTRMHHALRALRDLLEEREVDDDPR